jgi:hypothetical protein
MAEKRMVHAIYWYDGRVLWKEFFAKESDADERADVLIWKYPIFRGKPVRAEDENDVLRSLKARCDPVNTVYCIPGEGWVEEVDSGERNSE